MAEDILARLTDKQVLLQLLEQADRGARRKIIESDMCAHLSARVRGQDHVNGDLARLIRLEWGKQRRTKPIANLLFLGPPAVGKTELAKALAEYLFGDERNMLRFNGPDFSGPEGKTRLIGTPTGYVGADAGGQLTRPMFGNRRRLILFDEIEKAYDGVYDLFLPLLGEGQLTEQGSGRVADYSESIVVMTTNAEFEAIGKITEQHEDENECMAAVKAHLTAAKVFRPELFSRIDRVYVFKPLEGVVVAEIAVLKMVDLAASYGLTLEYVEPDLVFEALQKTAKFERYDAREVERMLVPMVGEALLLAREAGARRIRLEVSEDGVLEVNPAQAA